MKVKHAFVGFLPLILAACGGGGDDGGGTPPANQAPVLTFVTTAIAFPRNSQSDLTVQATDPDGDPLTITWEYTRGSLTAQNTQNTIMRWAVPPTAGTDTMTIRANDGSVTTTLTVEVKAGTLQTSNTALSAYIKLNSPYILDPSDADPRIAVIANATMNVEPGVELLINTEGTYFDVAGDVEAHGTQEEPIVIRPNNRTFKCTTDPKWWEGFRGVSNDTDGLLDMEYVQIWDANWGVRLLQNSRAVLRDCKILCSGEAGIRFEGNGSFWAVDTRISDGIGDGISIGGAASVSLPDSIRIEGCAIVFNGSVGIRMDLQDTSQIAPITVSMNQIEFNGSHGISLARSVFPSIHNNAFRGNGDQTVSNLFLQGGYPGVAYPVLDATCNFWGTAANQATIDLTIRDSLDVGSVGTRVDSCPWLTASPITGTPTCTCPVP